MPGNPKDSKWRSIPNEKRHRKQVKLTLSDEAMAKLDRKGAEHGSRSGWVEQLILEAPDE